MFRGAEAELVAVLMCLTGLGRTSGQESFVSSGEVGQRIRSPKKSKQASDHQHDMSTAKDGQAKELVTDCSVPETAPSDGARRKLMSEFQEPITVKTKEPEQTTFWKTDDPSETKILPMRNWDPKVTCLASCKCYPAQGLQVYELAVSCKEQYNIMGEADISGFFAIRDYYDRRRIYIFNYHEMKNPASTINFINGVGNMGVTTPCRGILYSDLVFDYDMKIKWSTNEGSREENIRGNALYEGRSCPYSSNAKIIQASIPINGGDSVIKEMNLKFVRFTQGIEAEIEIQPPKGFNFRLTARMGNIADEIVLFDGEFDNSNGTSDHKSLKFVLVVPFLDILELKFTSPDHTDEGPKIYKFKSFYHGLSSKGIDFGSSMINMKITWSRM